MSELCPNCGSPQASYEEATPEHDERGRLMWTNPDVREFDCGRVEIDEGAEIFNQTACNLIRELRSELADARKRADQPNIVGAAPRSRPLSPGQKLLVDDAVSTIKEALEDGCPVLEQPPNDEPAAGTSSKEDRPDLCPCKSHLDGECARCRMWDRYKQLEDDS